MSLIGWKTLHEKEHFLLFSYCFSQTQLVYKCIEFPLHIKSHFVKQPLNNENHPLTSLLVDPIKDLCTEENKGLYVRVLCNFKTCVDNNINFAK